MCNKAIRAGVHGRKPFFGFKCVLCGGLLLLVMLMLMVVMMGIFSLLDMAHFGRVFSSAVGDGRHVCAHVSEG